MNLAEKMRKETNERKTTKAEIIAEITKYFSDILETEKFSSSIENLCRSAISQGDNYAKIDISFWIGADGCSWTNFSIGSFMWKSPSENRYTYKGIDLHSIHYEVELNLEPILTDFLLTLGFKVNKSQAKYDGWGGNRTTTIEFSWQ